MKITLNIADPVMVRLKQEAARQRRTMSELVETALRRFFEQKEKLEIPQLPTFHEGRERVDIANRGALNVVLGRRILGNVRFDR